MFKAVIFDLDGTLANTLESISYTCNQCLKKVNLQPRPVEEYKGFIGDGTRTLIKRALAAAGDMEGKNFTIVFDSYTEMFKQNCTYKVTAYKGIRDTLAELKNRGIQLAVFSNKKHERANQVVEYLFGENIFDMILGQRDSFPVKPDPSGALSIAQQFGVLPAECVYVGDTEVDMETGHRAGMFTLGVQWGFREAEALKAKHPQAIIEKPDQILSYFE